MKEEFVCKDCGYRKEVPKHCGGECRIEGDKAVCTSCGFTMEAPKHCSGTYAIEKSE